MFDVTHGLTGGPSAACRFAQQHGIAASVAVLDTATGALEAAGEPRLYTSASLAKVLIAAQLLRDGTSDDRALPMITRSDNAAAYALYQGDELLLRVAAAYDVPDLGAPPTTPGRWGSTQLSAPGLARLYGALRADPVVWPWLSSAMHAWEPRDPDGEPNDFGLAAVAPDAAVKNGWVTGEDYGEPEWAYLHTTGYVDADRYAVVVLTRQPVAAYYEQGMRFVTRLAELVCGR